MNFSEFKRQLGAEPRNQDPDFLAARDSDPEFRAAAEEAERFEDRLDAALSMKMPLGLLEGITRIPQESARRDGSAAPQTWRWVAAAAAIVVTVGFASMRWYESTYTWESVEAFAADIWTHDGAMLLQQADGRPMDQAEASDMFASLGLQASPALMAQIDVLHKCRTPDARGAHMVVITEQGPVTLIFMPKVQTENGHVRAFGEQVAATLSMQRGSALVIGPNEEIISAVYAMAREGLQPISKTG